MLELESPVIARPDAEHKSLRGSQPDEELPYREADNPQPFGCRTHGVEREEIKS